MVRLEDEKRVITKKPISPSVLETKSNPRARSAKLRIIEKI
jgi:16S rRNA (cytosine1402-N4)-methyltransferase